jgi:XTP/dITP diphosphohydrolase
MFREIVLASNNVKKCHELQAILSKWPIHVLPQSQFKIAPIAETGLTFVENAILKARHASLHSGLPALADDSGLEVPILKGEPGIYSARYAGENASDQDNVERLLERLTGIPEIQRQACFVCVIVFLRDAKDPIPIICEGYWYGCILEQPRGYHGFGYDPIFYVPENKCTAAELHPTIKNQISHRARALKQLLDRLKGQSVLYDVG